MRDGDRKDIYLEWKAGDATPIEAARLLMIELGEVESELSLIKAQKNQLRERLGEAVSAAGDKVQFKGLGRAILTAPSVGYKYDKKKLDSLLRELTAQDSPIAPLLAQCQEPTENEGTLRVEFERAVKP